MFDVYWEVKKEMQALGLVSDYRIQGGGQCGFADLNPGGFYFLVKDRDEIARRLEKTGYAGAFLALVAFVEEKGGEFVYFHRDYHVRQEGVIALGSFNLKQGGKKDGIQAQLR